MKPATNQKGRIKYLYISLDIASKLTKADITGKIIQ